MICHSWGHTTDRCEYNLLNQQAAPMRHMEPRHGQEPVEERFRREDRYRQEREDRYNERRRDDYEHEHDRNDRRKEGYNRDWYERDYYPNYDWRRNDKRYPKRQGNRNFQGTQRRGYFRREERWEAAREYNQGPSTNTVVTPLEQRKTEENRRITSVAQIGSTNKKESHNNQKVYCYYCRKDGHYSNQCLIKSNEKQPAVNMVTADVTDVQQVTTRSNGKAAEWETQENIRKQTTEWIKKANERNVGEIQEQNAQPEEPVKNIDDDPT